ncbi:MULTISPECIES: M20 aminoacylase family protein [Phyllobacteriaceae]|jgi:amidohydrolase|uniref:Peptidase M20 n=1 Tax=Mesorhizobium hungaricum TaxID=1566387 RepID=A0A1C2EDY4_9HYPH|nr:MULTISPECIES: M20 aminoacylase family protein [Mesorhizobium]MBN9237819.1 amidohydrolase [Mesorhizobium sp.]MDQ0329485.1 hippurate hydrolase [Mesorhizobium sp. YL-MeA3-2017]OCX25177.1 peptidase M20 [Mesorhizobium hungaricum]
MASAEAFFRDRQAVYAGWRQHLHQWPEVAFKEHQTAAFLTERLVEMGLQVETGIAGTGLVATLEGRKEGPSIALRADMDALPMQEEGNRSYRSRNDGISHACGHDGHMIMLLAAADYLVRERDFGGRVRFIFQPAEEAEGGGRLMVEQGLFDRFPVDAVFGLHNWPNLPLGTVAVRPGPMMAAMDLFTIVINARGVHAALPHLGTDAIAAAGALISSLQSITSRSVDALQPTVVSLTQIHGGNSLNALPGEVTLHGTVRAFSDAARAKVRERLDQIVEGVAITHQVRIALTFEPRYPATINDNGAAGIAEAVVEDLWGRDAVLTEFEPSMASEDFAFMLNAKTGCYVWIGNGNDTPLHNPAFDFNDALIPLGALYWTSVATNWSTVKKRN